MNEESTLLRRRFRRIRPRLARWAVYVLLLGLAGGVAWWFRDRTHDRVYRIGFHSSPPAQIVSADGRPQGAILEILMIAARRTGVRLQWVQVPEGPDVAFRSRQVDLWPLIDDVPERRPFVYVSDPYLRLSFWAVRRESTALPGRWEGLRVARGGRNVPLQWSQSALPGAQFVDYENQRAAAEATCRGEIDFSLVVEGIGDAVLLRRPPGCDGVRLALSTLSRADIWLGVGADRWDRGARQTADRLRDTIGQMAIDGGFASAALNWGLVTSSQPVTVYQYIEALRKENQLRAVLAIILLAVAVLAVQERRLLKARQAADEASRAKSAFLAAMSHEIRTPMSGVLGMSELMLQTPLSVEQRDLAETISQSGQALLELINDILDLAKVEAGKMALRREVCDPAGELLEVARLFRARASQTGLELKVERPAGEAVTVLGDARRIRQVLANLVSNALKFTRHGGVTLRLAFVPRKAGEVLLRYEVEDTGIGIADDFLPRLFQPFTQATRIQSEAFGGTGLGLAICRELAALMNGRVSARSVAGQGSTFVFEIPVALAPATASAGPVEATPARQPSPARVLVVDDNAINRKLVERMLAKLGCSAVLAESGPDALRLAEKERFDLVLMDWRMPGMDGLETSRRMKSQWPPEWQVPIVVLTANAMDGDRQLCLDAGMSDYLAKPLQLASLTRVLSRWVKARPNDAPPPPSPEAGSGGAS